MQFLVEGRPVFNPTEPSWTLWFLLALAIFRLVLPYLVLLRWPQLWAALLSVGVGYLENVDSTFSLSRAIGILPFFVLGWQLRQWKVIDSWRDPGAAVWGWRSLAVAVFAGWLVVVAFHVPKLREFGLKNWFFYDDSYLDLGEPVWWAGLLRLGLIVLRESGVLRDDHASATWLLTMIFASTVIAIALSSPVVRRLFRPLVEPKPRWLFRATDDRPGESRRDVVGARREGSGPTPSHHGYAALQSSWHREHPGT